MTDEEFDEMIGDWFSSEFIPANLRELSASFAAAAYSVRRMAQPGDLRDEAISAVVDARNYAVRAVLYQTGGDE